MRGVRIAGNPCNQGFVDAHRRTDSSILTTDSGRKPRVIQKLEREYLTNNRTSAFALISLSTFSG